MAAIGVYAVHDAGLALCADGQYYVVEAERFFNERYYGLLPGWSPGDVSVYARAHRDLSVLLDYAIREWIGCALEPFDVCAYSWLTDPGVRVLQGAIPARSYVRVPHHVAHVACAFYQSGFDEALVISCDGGGDDGGYLASIATHRHPPRVLDRSDVVLGAAYGILGNLISEMTRPGTGLDDIISSNAGKLMGLAGFGSMRPVWIEPVRTFFRNFRFADKAASWWRLSVDLGRPLASRMLSGGESADFAATVQHVLEEEVTSRVGPLLRQHRGFPVCLTGGVALNVLLNSKLAGMTDQPVFVPPNPSDAGLPLGTLLHATRPEGRVEVAFRGLPIRDLGLLPLFAELCRAVPADVDAIAKLLADGKIIGVMRGLSECGPRALGHRSILANPADPSLKERLNSRIKMREAFRPYAPVVRFEDQDRYFTGVRESPYMSFAASVRPEWRDRIPAIVHTDGSARVQTVRSSDNPWLWQLLGSFATCAGHGVLLNTSLNSKGKPLAGSLEQAFAILRDTELDCLLVEDTLFSKERLADLP